MAQDLFIYWLGLGHHDPQRNLTQLLCRENGKLHSITMTNLLATRAASTKACEGIAGGVSGQHTSGVCLGFDRRAECSGET